jgi:UDP-glucose 4-epimerase
MGVECRVIHLEPRNEVKIAFSGHSKAERVFGRRPKVPLEEGIRHMASWAKAHGARESSSFHNIEISRNLPASWVIPASEHFVPLPI